jgi:hypothetical protein
MLYPIPRMVASLGCEMISSCLRSTADASIEHQASRLNFGLFNHLNAGIVSFLPKSDINTSQEGGCRQHAKFVSRSVALAMMHKQCHHYQPRVFGLKVENRPSLPLPALEHITCKVF